mmetsp:Transcript_20096/g.52677  ORF Transcript_20096/g.52677 Transcript_20096/m.52677 type:complete len:244 (+) Transcript_20096:719-1450(+)
MSEMPCWILREWSCSSSLYCLRHARTSLSLNACTSWRSLGPVPRGRCRATISRHRESLLPFRFRRSVVDMIHLRFSSACRISSAPRTSLSCSSSGVGFHRGPFLASASCAASLGSGWLHHALQNLGVLTSLSLLAVAASSGNRSTSRRDPAFLSSSNLKSSLAAGLAAPPAAGSRSRPSDHSCRLTRPFLLRSRAEKASRADPKNWTSSARTAVHQASSAASFFDLRLREVAVDLQRFICICW